MTNEDALNKLKECVQYAEITKLKYMTARVDALEVAIKALEKQIPRKLYVEEDADTKTYYCKNCDVEIYQKGCMHIRRAVLIPGKPKYCYNCGQRLDWGKE